jgi:hypothetical protein
VHAKHGQSLVELHFFNTLAEIYGDNHLMVPGEFQVDPPSLFMPLGENVESVLHYRILYCPHKRRWCTPMQGHRPLGAMGGIMSVGCHVRVQQVDGIIHKVCDYHVLEMVIHLHLVITPSHKLTRKSSSI